MGRRYTGGIKSGDDGPDSANDEVLAKDDERTHRTAERARAVRVVEANARDAEDESVLLAALGLVSPQARIATGAALLAAASAGLLWLGHHINSLGETQT